MGRKNPSKIHIRAAVVLCLLAVSGLNAESTCRKGCPQSDNGLLQYAPGNVYEYNFDSVLTVALSAHINGNGAAESDDTNLKVVGAAKLFAEGNCGYTLQLTGVQVTASKESIEKKITQSINKPVHFTMVSGKIQPELCTDASDTAYALNVKRAIISLLQSSTEGEKEVDVFGQCPTHTSVSKIGGAEIITKVRNLNNCAYREQIRNGIVNGVVNEKSGVKSTMLLKADYSKEAKVERGVIENVQLVEEYSFTGATKGGPGVHAKVMTTLVLKNSGAAAAPPTGNHASSIIFQKPETYAVKNIAALKNALTHTIQLVDSYVKKDAGKHFVELIRLMRNANSDTLLELAAFPHPNKVLARKVYLDALFRTGTAESVKAIIRQMNKMDDKEKKIAMLSMNLVQTVDKDTMNQAAVLLGGNSPKEAFLAVGHIVSKYCQSHGCEQTDIEVISKKFTDALKHCKANTKNDEERIVYVLKGIRNTHHVANSVTPALVECAATGHSNRIRVAALQAFAAASCDSVLQQKALELLHDHNEDSELRIEAYLAAIECPTAELSNQIADIVNSETVYQVGGFIASNLKTIRDSTDAKRENQRHYLGNIRVTKNFPKDYRRYSFDNELSYKLDAMGLSASGDYQLIYSQHGFLPRSARLNFTTEVFGTNFNVFEASVRQENLENVLEYYLGPKGLLNKDFDEIIELIQTGGAGAGGRARRSIADDTGKFAKKYKTYGTKNIQDLNLDLSLKLFGTEMFFMSLGDNIPSSLEDLIKHFSTIFDDVKKGLSSFNKEFNMHSLFMDSEFMYPTGVGFPLELSAQGFAANKLDFGIEFDVDAILQQNWQGAKYRFKVVPSVDINVNMQLGFNTYVLSTGTRVVTSLHSATGSDVHFECIDGGNNGFNIDIELPREKLELIDLQLSTDFYIAEQDKDVKSIALKGSKKRKQETTQDCFNQFEIIGFSICFATSIPDFGKALTQDGVKADGINMVRPFSFTLYMTSERKFNLKGYHVPQTATGAQQWKLDYSTPGSKVSHDTSLAFELGSKPRVYGRASFDHPQYHFALEAGIINDNKELVLYGQYEFENEVKKNKIGFVKNGNEYRPVIEVQDRNGVSNEINGYRADGRVVVQQTGEKQARYNFENFQVVNKNNERVVVNGWADVGPASFNSELRVAPGQESFLIKSNLKMDNGEFSVGLFVNDEKTPDNIMGGSARVKLADNEVDVDLVAKANTWQVESINAVQYEKADGGNAILSSKFKNELSVHNKNNIVGAFKLNGLTEGQNKVEVDAEIVRGKKVAAVAVKFSGNQRNQGDYQLVVNGKLNKHFVEILATCDIKANVFLINNVITTSWGTSLTAKGEVGQRFTAQDIHIDLQGSAQFSNKDKPSQWILKVLGTPEKTNSEFKLSRDNAEVIKYVGELQHPQDKVTAGKINMQVKNIMTAKADFKVAKNGKGELSANVEMLKTEPKHKLELNSKFHVLAPKYDVELTATLDTDKKIYFKTENIVDKLKFSTKNIAEIAEKKVSFDANGLIKGEWRMNGEIQGNFALTCPEGRVIDGSLKRKLTTNARTGISQGSMDVQVNDQLANGQKRVFAWNSKLDKANFKTKEISGASHIVYTNFEGKKLDLVYNLKHLSKQQSNMIDFKITTTGDLITTPIDISLIVDDYNEKSATYRASGKIGDYGSGKINGNYNVGVRGSPTSYEIQGNVQMPQSSFKTFEINSSGKFMKPETEEGGTYMAEIHVDERIGNEQFVKFNSIWKGSGRQGVYNMDLETQKMNGVLKMEGSYQRENEGSLREGTASGKQKYAFNFNYADKYIKSTADMSFSGADTASIHYTLDSSFESAKDIDLLVRGQKSETESYLINMQTRVAGNTYMVESKFFGSAHKKGLDLHATLPSGEPIVVVGIVELLGEKKIKLTLDVANLADLDLKGNVEASYKSVNDFYIVGQWNSVKLNLHDFDLDVRSQEKAITFNLKNAEGVVLAGSATYALKREKNKSILEGQGQLQYNGKNQNTNFKLIRQHYDQAGDKEVGFSYTFNGNLGPKNGVSTLKITNKEFNVKFSVCEEKKQCTNVQVQSIVAADEQDVDTLQHSLLVLIDLREFGYPHEFELQSKTIRQGLKFQYSLDSNIISNNNMKYQLVANVLPSSSKVQIKLPSREISFETQQQFPARGHLFGHYENSAAFYFDKTNKPNDVTRLVASADITGIESIAINAKGQLKFEHPTIRPLTVSGKLDANRQEHFADAEIILDIFRVPEQQVVASSRIQNARATHGFNITTIQVVRSGGLGFHYELNGHTALNTESQEISAGSNWRCGASDTTGDIYFFGSKDRVELNIHGMDELVFQIVGEFNRQKLSSKFETKVQGFGPKAIELISEVHPSMMKFSVQREGLLDITGEIKLGKEAKFNIVGAGKPLYNGRIALDSGKFLQHTFESDEEGMKAFLETVQVEIKKDTDMVIEQIRKRFQKTHEVVDRQIHLAKESTPDFTQLKANYEHNVNEIVKELENDPSLKQIIDTYRKLYATFAKIAGDVAKTAADSFEKLHKSFVALHTKLETIFKDTVLPAWEEIAINLSKIIGTLRVEIITIHSKAFHYLLEIVDQYGPTLKNYGKVINESLKPINEAAQELYKIIAHATEELIIELREQLAKIPTFDALRTDFLQKLEKIKLLEKTLEFINNLFDQLHILPQTAESAEFLQRAHEYIEAKLKQEKVDDEKLMEELFKLLVKAIRSFLASLDVGAPAEAAGISTNSISALFTSLPYSANTFSKLPALLSFRFSLFNLLLNENWTKLFTKDIFNSWIFFHDFELHGHVAGGRHFFTFDGQQVSFAGSCKYILAQDSYDNNFTVVAQLNNGKMKSITVTDRDGAFMEINDSGVLKINGAPVEFPQHMPGMHAWRQFYTVWLRSEYGVQVMCTTDLKICHIEVNGFYTSKTRGLLGNGNAEPNDDFVKVDGTIASDYAGLVNDYGLGKCNPITYEDHSNQQRTDICDEIFAHDSLLALGYLTLNSAPYRSACDLAVSAAAEKDVETAACTIALAYASALHMQDFFISLPIRCLKCAGAAGQREIGQEFTVKTPNNKADVVFVVDTGSSENIINNLITPVISEVREALKTRGFTDVQIAVIAYNEHQRYPALITSDNGKINYQGKFSDVHLDGPKNFCENCVSQVASDRKLLEAYELVERFIRSIVPQSDEVAFRMALDYPFRAAAAKSIVGVRSNALGHGNVFKLVRAHIIGAASNFDGAILHLISPVKDLSLEGIPSEKLVGFNSRLVATLDGKDNKKRQKLQFHNDMGIDFVLDNGGWVFSTQNFDKLKPEDQKKTLNQITSSIADTLLKTEIVSECMCVSVRGLHTQHKCAIKSSTFVANKKPKTA